MLELIRNLQKITGVEPPGTALPLALAKAGNMFARMVLQRKGGIPNELIDRLQHPFFFDPGLARRELGLPQSNIWEAMKRHVASLKKLQQI